MTTWVGPGPVPRPGSRLKPGGPLCRPARALWRPLGGRGPCSETAARLSAGPRVAIHNLEQAAARWTANLQTFPAGSACLSAEQPGWRTCRQRGWTPRRLLHRQDATASANRCRAKACSPVPNITPCSPATWALRAAVPARLSRCGGSCVSGSSVAVPEFPAGEAGCAQAVTQKRLLYIRAERPSLCSGASHCWGRAGRLLSWPGAMGLRGSSNPNQESPGIGPRARSVR